MECPGDADRSRALYLARITTSLGRNSGRPARSTCCRPGVWRTESGLPGCSEGAWRRRAGRYCVSMGVARRHFSAARGRERADERAGTRRSFYNRNSSGTPLPDCGRDGQATGVASSLPGRAGRVDRPVYLGDAKALWHSCGSRAIAPEDGFPRQRSGGTVGWANTARSGQLIACCAFRSTRGPSALVSKLVSKLPARWLLSAKGKGISSCASFCRCQGSSCEKFGLNPPLAQDNDFSLCVAITRNTAKNQTSNALAVAGGFRHSSLNLLVGSAIRSQLFGHSEDGDVGRD